MPLSKIFRKNSHKSSAKKNADTSNVKNVSPSEQTISHDGVVTNSGSGITEAQGNLDTGKTTETNAVPAEKEAAIEKLEDFTENATENLRLPQAESPCSKAKEDESCYTKMSQSPPRELLNLSSNMIENNNNSKHWTHEQLFNKMDNNDDNCENFPKTESFEKREKISVVDDSNNYKLLEVINMDNVHLNINRNNVIDVKTEENQEHQHLASESQNIHSTPSTSNIANILESNVNPSEFPTRPTELKLNTIGHESRKTNITELMTVYNSDTEIPRYIIESAEQIVSLTFSEAVEEVSKMHLKKSEISQNTDREFSAQQDEHVNCKYVEETKLQEDVIPDNCSTALKNNKSQFPDCETTNNENCSSLNYVLNSEVKSESRVQQSENLLEIDTILDNEKNALENTLNITTTPAIIVSDSTISTSESQNETKDELNKLDLVCEDSNKDDIEDGLPPIPTKMNEIGTFWKVGYLQVKLPAKSRGRGKLKVWQQRWVVVQADEFVNDPDNIYLMISVYNSESSTTRHHGALFWRSVSAHKALVYRSKSRSHKYTFSITDDTDPIVHLASDCERTTQEWMTAIRAILWPPAPVLQLEKVLSGTEFEISVIDNDFSYHAGLLGSFGYLSVTGKKLILTHPHTGHVIQEWYLNTIDKFQLLPQLKEEDSNKVLIMHTSSESSTGYGQIQFYCTEAVDLLRAIASTIHKVLQCHNRENGGKYQKELSEMAEWLTPQPSPSENRNASIEDYYKVPKRQVKSLLDIPNFIFDHPKRPASINADATSNVLNEEPKLTPSNTCVSTFSQDSGISVALPPDDFLNCSITSFSIGSGRSRSSDSESSDPYTPPVTPKQERRQTEAPNEDIEYIKNCN